MDGWEAGSWLRPGSDTENSLSLFAPLCFSFIKGLNTCPSVVRILGDPRDQLIAAPSSP